MKVTIKFLALLLLASSCQNALLDPETAAGFNLSRGVVGPGTETHFNSDFTHVRLSYAQPFNYAVSGMSFNSTTFRVTTRSVGLHESRRVFIHYTTGGAWQDFELTNKQGFSYLTVFTGTLQGISRLRFAVRFESSAGTWWDNNRGADYWVQPWSASGSYRPGVVGGGISLLNATTEYVPFGGGGYGWRVRGQIAIDTNTFPSGYPTGAGIRILNTPNWTGGAGTWTNYWHFTYQYSMTSAPNIRVFSFESDPVDQYSTGSSGWQPTLLRYVVFAYRNTSATHSNVYWDNNFGLDYHNVKSNGSLWY